MKLKKLCDKYGSKKTIGEILKLEMGDKVYICPKCKGTGYETIVIHGVLGYTNDEFFNKTCVLCNGIGYTNSEYKPKYIQDGWEKVEDEY